MAKLFLTDGEHGSTSPAIAAIWKIDLKQIRQVDDLKGVANEVGKFKQLDELVMNFHGFAGGILLGGEGFKLSDQKVKDIFAKTTTKIEHIRFEGCWVGEAPDEMAAFGRLFSSSFVSGFTWTSWNNDIEVKVPKGISPKDLRKFLSRFEKWLMPGSPDMGQLASLAKSHDFKKTLLLLWYQYTLQTQPPYENDNYKRLGSHTYKARSEVTNRTVEAKDAKTSDSPVPPFEYVTVKL
jgi:hypothetical protein